MSKPWISDTRQRQSKRYGAIHAQFVQEILAAKAKQAWEPSKIERKRAASMMFRRQGES